MDIYPLSKKILVVTNIPTPYRIPLFNELKRQLEVQKLKLNVIFGDLKYFRHEWSIEYHQKN